MSFLEKIGLRKKEVSIDDQIARLEAEKNSLTWQLDESVARAKNSSPITLSRQRLEQITKPYDTQIEEVGDKLADLYEKKRLGK